MSTVQNTNVLTAVNMPQATPSTVALTTTVLFANALVISPASVRTDDAPSVTIRDTSSMTALSWRTPARGLSLMREIQRGCDFVPEVQIFEGGIVMVQEPNLIFSVIHFSPLSSDLPFTFTVSVLFSTDVYWYMVQ